MASGAHDPVSGYRGTDRPTGEASRGANAWALLAIVLAALLLRVVDLGRMGLWIDEDLTALVARSIRDSGWPLLPSGEVYTRGALYSYLVAGFTGIFGDNETVLRLPSVLFSLGTIVVGYLYARSLGGRAAGFLAALILAASPWELHYARMARMYALLAFLVLAGVYCVHLGWIRERRGARWLAGLSAFLAVPTHQIGSTLALAFLLPQLPRNRGRHLLASFVGVTTTGAAIVLYRVFKSAAKEQAAGNLDLVVAVGGDASSFSIPLLPALTLNHSRWILSDLWQTAAGPRLVATLGIALAIGLTVHALRRTAGVARDPLLWLLTAAFLAAIVFNQLVLGALVGAALWARSGQRRVGIVLVVGLSLGTLGLLLGQLWAAGTEGVLSRSFLRLFFALPVPFYRVALLHHPVLHLVGAGAALVALLRVLREKDDGRFFLATVTFGLLLLMGLFDSPYVIHRYTFYLNPVWIVLFATAIVDAARWVSSRLVRPRFAFAAIWILGLLASGQFDPIQAYRATQVDAGYGREVLSDPDLTSHFRYDFRGTALYLTEHAAPSDLLVSKDPVELRAYGIESGARVNALYSVYARDPEGAAVDWYLGIPILHTRPELEAWIAEAGLGYRRVWLVCPEEVSGGPAVHLPEEIHVFLLEHTDREVFRARDGITRIFRFDPPRD